MKEVQTKTYEATKELILFKSFSCSLFRKADTECFLFMLCWTDEESSKMKEKKMVNNIVKQQCDI